MTDIDWSERIDQAIREYPEVGEYLEAIRGNIEALASRLAAVEKLHTPVDSPGCDDPRCCDTTPLCAECIGLWPCLTIKAVRGE